MAVRQAQEVDLSAAISPPQGVSSSRDPDLNALLRIFFGSVTTMPQTRGLGLVSDRT